MLSGISSGSPYITVSSPVSPYVDESGPLRWNGNSQQIEVMTQYGYSPLAMTNSVTIIQSSHIDMVVNWALQRIQEESRLAELLKEHPGLKDAKDKYEVMLALVRKENEDVAVR